MPQMNTGCSTCPPFIRDAAEALCRAPKQSICGQWTSRERFLPECNQVISSCAVRTSSSCLEPALRYDLLMFVTSSLN